jgi:hypothetical protein
MIMAAAPPPPPPSRVLAWRTRSCPESCSSGTSSPLPRPRLCAHQPGSARSAPRRACARADRESAAIPMRPRPLPMPLRAPARPMHPKETGCALIPAPHRRWPRGDVVAARPAACSPGTELVALVARPPPQARLALHRSVPRGGARRHVQLMRALQQAPPWATHRCAAAAAGQTRQSASSQASSCLRPAASGSSSPSGSAVVGFGPARPWRPLRVCGG